MTPLGADRAVAAGLLAPRTANGRAASDPTRALAPLRIRPARSGRTPRARASRFGSYNFDRWNF